MARNGDPIMKGVVMEKTGFDVDRIKQDFPVFERQLDGKRIVYLDSANSSFKPRQVIDAMSSFMSYDYAPINRSSYKLAAMATDHYEGARTKVASFIGAHSTNEVIFTKNATESMNLIVRCWGGSNLGPGDVVVLTEMEHHANIVPWFQLASEKGFTIRWIPVNGAGELDLENLDTLLAGAKALSFTAMSNVLGTITPVRLLTDAAHAAGAIAIVDACQFVPHNVMNVDALGADFMAFSSHKMCGPTGIGILWGREDLLEAMPPFLGGGNMISDVRFDGFTLAELPHKFEAGTPPIIEAVGLGAAIDYVNSIGLPAIRQHEMALTRYALDTLGERFGDDITIHGPNNVEHRGAVLSIAFRGIHPHDLSQILDESNVCIRAGHHCAKPLMRAIGAGATARASFYLYNDESDVDALATALSGAGDVFGL
jgi:cysteine desulfurase / selenocysteine lyase